MDINERNSHSNGSQSSKVPKNVREDMEVEKKEASDSLYVNHAEVAWHEMRRAWVGDKSQNSQRRRFREPIMSWTTTYDELLSNMPFREPIPLAEMVDFLVDIWLDDGLYN